MTQPRITKRRYGVLTDGRTVDEYTLDNGRGMSLCAINFGGIVTALNVPDRDGIAANIVLGLPNLHDYETRNPNMGTIVGRYANRIAGGRFELDGETFELPRNNGTNTLHGGPVGFGKRWWDIAPLPIADDGSVAIELSLDSAAGDQGFPGRLQATVRYTLTPQDEWRIDYAASTDRATVVNLSQHAYFNLAGQGSIQGHRLQIAAARYCPVDPSLIPLGIEDVEGTPFDFRAMTPIGARIRDAHAQILLARGYDHNWVLDSAPGAALRLVARLEEQNSGRAMQVHTDQPGLQFYSGNFLDGTLAGANGQAIRQGDGLCLETQHFPDSPNRSDFPSTVLRPGERYASTTVYRFGLCSP
ncbi:MAG: aldose epimerase family protein [Ramlibacter sp.]